MAKSAGLTSREISALKPRAVAYEVRDPTVTGAYVQVWPSGAVSYLLRYRLGEKKVKLTIGKFDPKSPGGLKDVRAKALASLADVHAARAKGNVALDPAAQKAQKKAARIGARAAVQEAQGATDSAADSVDFVLAEFKAKYLSKLRTGGPVARALEREVLPIWKGRRLTDITRADVHRVLDQLVARGKVTQANRVLAYLSKFANWAVSRGVIDRSFCEKVERPGAEKQRDRVLDDRELTLVWKAADRMGWPFGPMTQLLLLTGQRRAEIADAQWSEVDVAAKALRLPAERTKNKRAHVCPMSPQAMSILEVLPRVEGAGFVFTTTGHSTVSGFSRAKKQLDTIITELNGGVAIPDWAFHDLRRSCASGMQRLGIQLTTIERLLNHVSGSFAGVVGIYQREALEPEKRIAVDSWGQHVECLVTGAADADGNVVEFVRAGQS
jgi:integrase